MIKKTLTYKDFDGDEVTEDLYFHLSAMELVQMKLDNEGIEEFLEKIVAEENYAKIIGEFKKILLAAYGKKSEDGRSFRKTPQMREELEFTAAFDALLLEICTNEKTAGDFINGLLPSELLNKAKQQQLELEGGKPAAKTQDRPVNIPKAFQTKETKASALLNKVEPADDMPKPPTA